LPILNILVPQLVQTPCVAGLPFFIVMALGLDISFLARHFTQYACIVPPFLEIFALYNKPIATLVSRVTYKRKANILNLMVLIAAGSY
jgi:hypothetical protein